jgi:hypothetical protein
MPILPSEIKFYHSGGSGNTNPNSSLGGAISTTELGSGIHNLFDIVSSAEAASGDSEYRCFYVKNTNATLTLLAVKLWITADNTGAGSDIQIALDNSGINGTASIIANENTAPTQISAAFSSYSSEDLALSIGNIPAGQHQAIWLKRIVNAGAPSINNANVTIIVKGDTPA